MVQTFSYRTETKDRKYYHTIHSVDLKGSVEKWVRQIEDLQAQTYSFDKSEVETIRLQFLSGQLKMHLDKDPFFLSYKSGDTFQVVNIKKVKKRARFYCKSYILDYRRRRTKRLCGIWV